MTEHARIDDLRRRVQQDPASIAFAQLAEEYRRSGHHLEAVDTCRAGLVTHPEYLSARVTLGRALLALGRIDEAADELQAVLGVASENLAAIRALADARRLQGRLAEAVTHYTAALTLAPNDPDLERSLAELAAERQDGQVATVPDPVRARRTVAALERWLEAIHAARTDRHP
ncbi:MAG: tetratricopeptide repeat protein [Vicinamibacterales bacterium]